MQNNRIFDFDLEDGLSFSQANPKVDSGDLILNKSLNHLLEKIKKDEQDEAKDAELEDLKSRVQKQNKFGDVFVEGLDSYVEMAPLTISKVKRENKIIIENDIEIISERASDYPRERLTNIFLIGLTKCFHFLNKDWCRKSEDCHKSDGE